MKQIRLVSVYRQGRAEIFRKPFLSQVRVYLQFGGETSCYHYVTGLKKINIKKYFPIYSKLIVTLVIVTVLYQRVPFETFL